MPTAAKFRPTVIVVDDEEVIADTLAQILKMSGFDAHAVYNGEEAIELSLARPPHVLITDVVMPGTNGIDLALSIRHIYPDCKILLFSGNATTTHLLSIAKESGHDFQLLGKPIHPADLLKHVGDALKG